MVMDIEVCVWVYMMSMCVEMCVYEAEVSRDKVAFPATSSKSVTLRISTWPIG